MERPAGPHPGHLLRPARPRPGPPTGPNRHHRGGPPASRRRRRVRRHQHDHSEQHRRPLRRSLAPADPAVGPSVRHRDHGARPRIRHWRLPWCPIWLAKSAEPPGRCSAGAPFWASLRPRDCWPWHASSPSSVSRSGVASRTGPYPWRWGSRTDRTTAGSCAACSESPRPSWSGAAGMNTWPKLS